MNVVELLYVLLLAVVMPVYGFFSWRKLVRRYERGTGPAKLELYSSIRYMHLALLVAVIGIWELRDYDYGLLGLIQPAGIGFWITAALVVAAAIGLHIAKQKAAKTPRDEAAALLDGLGTLKHIMPYSAADYRGFMGVSLTAGIAEELVYRGFLIWYLQQFMPLWAAVVVSSLIFGLDHSYQGASGILKVTLVGMVFAALYVGSGSIWLPIVAHAVYDMQQGAVIRAYAAAAGWSDDGPTSAKPAGSAVGDG